MFCFTLQGNHLAPDSKALGCGQELGATDEASLLAMARESEEGEVLVARLRFRMDRPPPLGDGDVEMAEGLLGPISSFEPFPLLNMLSS